MFFGSAFFFVDILFILILCGSVKLFTSLLSLCLHRGKGKVHADT